MNKDICSVCGCCMRVTGSRDIVKGDNSPETETQIFTVLTLECVNPQCEACGHKTEVSIKREAQHEE